MQNYSGLVDLIYTIAMALFIASPIIIFFATRYYFYFVPTDSKRLFKKIVLASLLIGLFFSSVFENLTAGIGFRIFLFPFFWAKWTGIIISIYFIVQCIYKNKLDKKKPLLTAITVLLIYISNSSIINYTIKTMYPATTHNKTLHSTKNHDAVFGE